MFEHPPLSLFWASDRTFYSAVVILSTIGTGLSEILGLKIFREKPEYLAVVDAVDLITDQR